MNAFFHIEVLQKQCSLLDKEEVAKLVHSYLTRTMATVLPGTSLKGISLNGDLELQNEVETVTFCDVDYKTAVPVATTTVLYDVYKLNIYEAKAEVTNDMVSGEKFVTADMWDLPHQHFHGLWDSLIYETNMKQDIIRFVETAFKLTDRGVDSNLISLNRLVLLHGPPGTGKTSLCRALAQKLSIRLRDRFQCTRLIEIHANALMSKYFSESSNRIAQQFDRINEAVSDVRSLVCVLVDEVETLAFARSAAVAGCDPSDSVRAVNTLLTHLDRLRRQPNVLILTTSNVTNVIDIAFLDRADIKWLVGQPSAAAAYMILRGCCLELMDRGLLERKFVFHVSIMQGGRCNELEVSSASVGLWEVAREVATTGVSGRTLRRLPLLALALHLPAIDVPTMEQFLTALRDALAAHRDTVAHLDSGRA